MSLVDQWNDVEKGLDPRWSEAELSFSAADESQLSRAAALLAPASPGRRGSELRIVAQRSGSIGPEAIRRLFRRLDNEGIDGELEVLLSGSITVTFSPVAASLADAWDAALAAVPSDWSDLFCELGLTSTDHADHAALLLGPINPLRREGRPGFRFRVARSAGYGAAPGMVRRCLGRLDDQGIPGDVRVLEAMSDSHHVGTQGPVWYISGKAV
jgi:hypothetical protein